MGAVAGAITGLAAFGIYKLFSSGQETGLSAEQLEEMEKLKTAHEKGFLSDEELKQAVDKVVNQTDS